MDDLTTGAAIVGVMAANKELVNEFAKPVLKGVGKALGLTVELLGTNYLQYRSDKQKVLHAHRIKQYIKNMDKIPEDRITQVPPEIGVPILQKLTYTTSDELADLFIGLLNSASSLDTIHLAQPRFIQIIEALSTDEARIIQYLRNHSLIPYIFMRTEQISFDGIKIGESVGKDLTDALTGIEKKVDFIFNNNMQFYLDNFSGMGLIKEEGSKQLSDETGYKELFDLYNVEAMIIEGKTVYPNADVICRKSYYQITNVGRSFIECCTSKL